MYRMHGLRDVGRLSAKLLQSLQTVVTSQVEHDFPIVRGAPLAGGHSVSRSDCGFLMRDWNSVPQQAGGVSHLLSQVCSGRRWNIDDRVAIFYCFKAEGKMKRKLRTLKMIATGASVWLSAGLACGQSCNCRNPDDVAAGWPHSAAQHHSSGELTTSDGYVSRGRQTFAETKSPQNYNYAQQPSNRLPAGWPKQWSGPAVSTQTSNTTPSEPTTSRTSQSPTPHSGTVAGPGSGRGNTAQQNSASPDNRGTVAQKDNGSSKNQNVLMVRDPFTGKMVPTAVQARFDRAANSMEKSKTQIAKANPAQSSTGSESVTPSAATSTRSSDSTGETTARNQSSTGKSDSTAQKSSNSVGTTATQPRSGVSSKPWSILPSRNGRGSSSGSAIGGGVGGGGGGSTGGGGGGIGGGIGGGTSGGGGTGGSSWNPQSGRSGGGSGLGGSSGNPTTGVLPFVANNDGPNDGPNDGCLTGIEVPVPTIPDSRPEIPDTGNPGHCGGGIIPGPGGTDSPVVPEPGSIILLGIAAAVGGADSLRRRFAITKPQA